MPLLRIEEYLAAGRYVQAQREVDRVLDHPDYAEETKARASLAGAMACLELQEYYAATKYSERALKWAEGQQAWNLVGLARFRLGCAKIHIGDWPEGTDLLMGFLRDLDRYPEHRQIEARAYYNLGLLHAMQNKVSDSLAYYERAFECASGCGDIRVKIGALQNSAWSLLLENRPEEARRYLARAEAQMPLASEESRVHQLCHRALYLRITGQISESFALCEEIFTPNRDGVTPHHKAEAAWIAGENALDMDQLNEAKIFSNLATGYALEARWPRLMNLVSRLRSRIHQYEYNNM